jgi:hypothetical protein
MEAPSRNGAVAVTLIEASRVCAGSYNAIRRRIRRGEIRLVGRRGLAHLVDLEECCAVPAPARFGR